MDDLMRKLIHLIQENGLESKVKQNLENVLNKQKNIKDMETLDVYECSCTRKGSSKKK